MLCLGMLLLTCRPNGMIWKKAQLVVDELPIQDLVLWNIFISENAQHGHNEGVLKCFKHMRRDGFLPKCHHFYLHFEDMWNR